MKKVFRKRGINRDPLLAHSFERVMPGKNYVASIRDFWRVCSGVNEEATRRVVKFLKEVINTEKYPLTVLDRPIESETAKIVENSFRATILAFLDEWSLFAEQNGVDLIKVINAIKVRPTHSNIIFPGPGIGGYCLPKMAVLAFGPIAISTGLRMIFSRLRLWPLTSMIRGPFMLPSLPVMRSGIWGDRLHLQRFWFLELPIVRT